MKLPENKILLIVCFVMFIVVAFILTPSDGFARAGGGGGKRGGYFYLLLLPFMLTYYAAFSIIVTKKYRQSRTLLEKLKRKDNLWDPDVIKHRITESFYKIQEAWRQRDQSIAKDYMSDSLLKKHQMMTNQMKEQGRVNIIEEVKLIKSIIIQVSDYKDDNKDCVWAYMRGAIIDYTIDEKTGDVLEGKKEWDRFEELWKFIRHSQKGWVLDLIEQEAGISEIANFESFSEELHIKEFHPLIEKAGRIFDHFEWTVGKGDDLEVKAPIVALIVALLIPWVIVAMVLIPYL